MHLRTPRLLGFVVALVLLASACGGGAPPVEGGGGGGGGQAAPPGTMVFGTSADPVVLDGALVQDGESIRAIDQMFEGLVGLRPGTTEIEPALAESWQASPDGREWTFNLRQGVRFHDGAPFNAEAVCFNFDRWYNFQGPLQNEAASYYWRTVFGGFARNDPAQEPPEESLYASCEARDERTAVITLTRSSSSFLSGLALTSFAMASPQALQQFGADEGSIDAENEIFRPSGTYGTEHPTGTGPFRFREWIRNDRLVLERNPDYWGQVPGNIETLIFRPVPDNAARLQALQSGEIQGYDLVAPEDRGTITGEGNQLLSRPPFNVAYVGMNQRIKPLDDLAVRQAVAHSINRQAIVDGFYAGEGEVATQFMPPSLFGWAPDVTDYPYDPARARQLLTEAGYQLPVRLPFAYPTDVSRPYMPSPQNNFEAMVADLERDGLFAIERQSAPWTPDYIDNAQNGRYGLYLLGWTGDFGDPDNFIGTFFQEPSGQWGFNNRAIFDALAAAEAETDAARREQLYQEANRLIMEFLPGLPYAHTSPAVGLRTGVSGYTPSPVTLEPFSLVTVGGA